MNIISKLNDYKYNILISLISIISVYYGYSYYKNIQFNESVNDQFIEEKKEMTVKVQEIDTSNLDYTLNNFLKEIKKSTKALIQFNSGSLNETNFANFRNKIFTKDVEKRLLVIDTKNIKNTETSDFKIHFTDSSENNANGYGPINNVIGFRLVKAMISYMPYHVHRNNDLLILNVHHNHYVKIQLTHGKYTPTSLATELKTQLESSPHISSATVTYNSSSFKYEISLGGTQFKLLFEDSENEGSHSWRLFGFKKENDTDYDTIRVSEHPIDHSHHFIDLVIDEIPSIACKIHPSGNKLIDRIPLHSPSGSLVYYMAPVTEFSGINYFYPITLKQLSIKLYEDTHDQLYQSHSYDHSFEFELTILKNTKMMN